MPGQVGHDQEALLLVTPDKGQDLAVLGLEKLQRPPPKGFETLTRGDRAFHPPEEGVGVVLLRLHIDGFVVIFRITDDRETEALRVGTGKARIAVGAPLHRRPHAVPIPEIDVIAHANLVAVIQHWGAGQGKEQTREEFNRTPVVPQQRRQAARFSRACASWAYARYM